MPLLLIKHMNRHNTCAIRILYRDIYCNLIHFNKSFQFILITKFFSEVLSSLSKYFLAALKQRISSDNPPYDKCGHWKTQVASQSHIVQHSDCHLKLNKFAQFFKLDTTITCISPVSVSQYE